MATNNVNSNYFSVSSYTNKGLSGMISGLDTEGMVKQMMAATQKKIDKQNAIKQQTLWRQGAYRDIIMSINSLRNKYLNPAFDASPLNNLYSGKFFNSMTSSVTAGSAAKVVSTASGAQIGEMKITVQQLASAASLTSGQAIGANDHLTAEYALSESMLRGFDKTLSLTVSGVSSPVVVDLNGIDTQEAMLQAIGDAFSGAGVQATVEMKDNKLRIVTSGPGASVRVNSGTSDLALQMTGLSRDQSSTVNTADPGYTLQGGAAAKPGAGISFTINLDGVDKQITVNPLSGAGGKITADTMVAGLNDEISRAFGSYIEASYDTVTKKISLNLNVNSGNAGHAVSVYGANAEKLGFTPGASSRLTAASRIGDIEGLGGDKFSFSINGRSFTFTRDDTIGAMISKVNSSNAGVQMSYSSVSNTFKLTATSTGKQYDINLNQSEGNLLSTIFKDEHGIPLVGGPAYAVSGLLTTDNIQGGLQGANPFSSLAVTKGATFTVNINGADHTFIFQGDESDEDRALFTIDELVNGGGSIQGLNDWLRGKFGVIGPDAAVEYDLPSNKLVIRDSDLTVKFAQTKADTRDPDAVMMDAALILGLNTEARSNIADGESLLGEIFQLKGIYEFMPGGHYGSNIDGTNSLDDLMNNGSGELSLSGGRLTLAAVSGTFPIDPSIKALFGGISSLTQGGGVLNQSDAAYKGGQDAAVTVNGFATTRASNLFEIDGITIQLASVSAVTGTDGGGNAIYEETIIGTERDTEAIVSAFKSFVEDYNALIDKLNGYLGAEATYRDYAPLTAEQKKEMSEKEIELWEEQAKGGLLRNDSTLSAFLNSIYSAIYSRPVSSPYAMYDIGIDSPDYKQPGRLTFDETKFREALAADPAGVEALFTDQANGIAKQMTTLMDGAARISIANPGNFVALAGIQGSYLDKNNSLSLEIERINDKLKDLQDKYQRERDRYWRQFNAMEQLMASYQAQSAYIAQMFTDSGSY